MDEPSVRNRTEYFDSLRVIATFAVIILHMSAQDWATAPVTSADWRVLNVYDSLVRCAVPLFVMISGALFLSTDRAIKRIFQKNILRIATAFVFWSVVYALLDFRRGCDLHTAIFRALEGHYHMWFLFMIVGLYLIVPLVRPIAASEALMKYFLLLALVFAFLLPQLITCIPPRYVLLIQTVRQINFYLSFHFTLGYVSYFVLGYYLSRTPLGKRAEQAVYSLGILGFAATALLTEHLSFQAQSAVETFYSPFSLTVLLESIGVFVFAKNHLPLARAPRARRLIRKLSDFSFGAYLIHPLFIELLEHFGVHATSFSPLLAVPLIALSIFAASMLLSALIHRIPVLKAYAV